MNLFRKAMQKLFNEYIDIIEWVIHTPETIIWRFSRNRSTIKKGTQLRVRKKQVAILVNKGEFADVYQPGDYELTTNNMPILTTQKGWKHDFNSPFKVDIYFVNTKEFLGMRWGTENPIIVRDPEFGPIRVRAFGSYCFRIEDNPIVFIRKIVGTDGYFTTDSVIEQLRKFVIAKFTDYLVESKITAFDLTSNFDEFTSKLSVAMASKFSDYGIELTKFLVENISLPETVKVALNKHTKRDAIGNMTTYTLMQFADALKN